MEIGMNRRAKIISLSTTNIGPTIEDYIVEDMRRAYEERMRGGTGRRPCIYGGLGAYLTECVREEYERRMLSNLPPGILSGPVVPDRDTRQRRRAEARKSGEKLLR